LVRCPSARPEVVVIRTGSRPGYASRRQFYEFCRNNNNNNTTTTTTTGGGRRRAHQFLQQLSYDRCIPDLMRVVTDGSLSRLIRDDTRLDEVTD
jgi:hypothetical protein